MGQSTIENLIEGAVMKRFSSSSAIKLGAVLILSASLLIKAIQFAFIIALTQSNGATVESLAIAVTRVFGGGVDVVHIKSTSESTISKDYMLGSFEADRGLRLFAFIYLCVWLVVGGLALTGLLLNRLMLIVLINLVVYMLGLCAESFLTVTLAPDYDGDGAEGSIMATFFSFFPLLVDCITNITLIVYCCWMTKNGMSFDPQEYQDEDAIRVRKHNISFSSTFRRFDTVDG